MIKGGYQIIDISGHIFKEGEYVKFDGIYETINKANKPIMLSGFKCMVDTSIDYARPSFVTLRKIESGVYQTKASGNLTNYFVTIKQDDTVSMTYDIE